LAATRTAAPARGPTPRLAAEANLLDLWLTRAAHHVIPPPDAEPLAVGDQAVPLAWRRHYVAALLPDTPDTCLANLEDLGFEVIRFGDPDGWEPNFRRLANLMGRGS
jgi:hypothetical protein